MTTLDEIKARLNRATDILFYPIDQPFIEEHIKDIERLVAACEVMRDGLNLIAGPVEFYCEIGERSKQVAAQEILAKADKILGGGE